MDGSPADGRNVFLCGLSGSGKSTLAPLLAELRGAEALDVDEIVVREAGMPIAEIFAREGEAGFRRREAAAVAAACARTNCVIALGGGSLEDATSRALIAASGTLVFLDVPLDILEGRLRRDSGEIRPLLAQPNALARLRERRLPSYGEAALRIDCGTLPVEEVATRVDAELRA